MLILMRVYLCRGKDFKFIFVFKNVISKYQNPVAGCQVVMILPETTHLTLKYTIKINVLRRQDKFELPAANISTKNIIRAKKVGPVTNRLSRGLAKIHFLFENNQVCSRGTSLILIAALKQCYLNRRHTY